MHLENIEPIIITSVIFVGFFIALLYLSRVGDEPVRYSRLHRSWRRIAFWAGDVCWLDSFPWVTWDTSGHDVSHEAWIAAIKQTKPGDVVLVTKKRYFISNSAIPGLFKHAAIITDGPVCAGNLCDITECTLVEAESEGVLKHHPVHARGDYMLVLRPKNVNEFDILKAVGMANKIVGHDYDAGFNFNIEEEVRSLTALTLITGRAALQGELKRVEENADNLRQAADNLNTKFDMAFSCTETVAVAWWHKRDQLRLYRRCARGHDVIVADQFVNASFDVVWTNVTPELALKRGLGEEGIELLKTYWKTHT